MTVVDAWQKAGWDWVARCLCPECFHERGRHGADGCQVDECPCKVPFGDKASSKEATERPIDAMIKIEFINLAQNNLKTVDAQAIVSALQTQIGRDFFPAWGVNATLSIAPPKQKTPTPGMWSIGFFDNADQAGALGYHDLTADGLPLGKVFVKTTLDDGALVSVTASHECLEMLGDPDINLTAEFDDRSGNPAKFYAYELCDAPESDSFGYPIGSVMVSDFVYPAYFEQFRKPGAQFDFKKHISEPFQILPGGYMGVLDLANLGAGWQQVTADKAPNPKSRAHVGSRRERRRTPRHMWMKSTY